VIFRNSRTPSKYISYGLYFYFSGLSLRKAAADSVDYQQIALSKETTFLIGTGYKNNPQWISSLRKRKSL
jgi:hypothetical protein